MLATDKITYQISDIDLLKNISVEMVAGQLSVILGPNGAGKSTLIKNLSGELKSTKGEVYLDSKNLKDWNNSLLASRRSVVTQFNSVNFPFNVSEIVMMGLLNTPGDSESADLLTRVEDMMKEMDIHHLQQRLYSTLSGGEQQRVSIARALVQVMKAANEGQACYLLLDEPTASLDLKHQHELMRLLKQKSMQKFCVVAILHDINLAIQYADLVILMKNGEVIATGCPNEIISSDIMKDVFSINGKLETLTDGSQRFYVME